MRDLKRWVLVSLGIGLWPGVVTPQSIVGPPDVRYAELQPNPADPTGGMRPLTPAEMQALEKTTRWTPSRISFSFNDVAESSLISATGQELAKVTVRWVGLERNPTPKTGDDLSRWRRRHSVLSAFQLGKEIGFAEADIRSAEALGRKAIPRELAEAWRAVYEGVHALDFQVWVENHSNCPLSTSAQILDLIDLDYSPRVTSVDWRTQLSLADPSPGQASGPSRLRVEAHPADADEIFGPNSQVPAELALDMNPSLSGFPLSLQFCKVKSEKKKEDKKEEPKTAEASPQPGGGAKFLGTLVGLGAAGYLVYRQQQANDQGQSCEFDVRGLVAAGVSTGGIQRGGDTVCRNAGVAGCTQCSQIACNSLTTSLEGPRGRVTCQTVTTASISCWPSAAATEMRWCPSRTK